MSKNYSIKPKTEQKKSINRFYNEIDFKPNEKVEPSGILWENYLDNEYTFLHYHRCLEFGITYSGTGIFHINDKNIRFNGPTISIIFDGIYHSASKTCKENSVWNFLYIDADALLKDSNIKKENYNNLALVISKNENEELFRCVELFIRFASLKIDNKNAILSDLLKIIYTLLQKYISTNREDNKDLGEILPAINFINKHYKEQISNKELADLCFLSLSTLRRKFSEITGMTPYLYIEKVRLSMAKSLLRSNGKIEEIAFACGYPSISAFNKKFKQLNGITPNAYQQNHKNKKLNINGKDK